MAREPTMKNVDWMFCDCKRLRSRGVYGEGPSSVAENRVRPCPYRESLNVKTHRKKLPSLPSSGST